MTCSQCRDNFTEYLEGALPAEARRAIEEHLGQCPECADDFAAFSATVGALRGLERVAPPAGLLEQIGQAVSAADAAAPATEAPRRRRWSWQHVGAAAVAASLLIGFATILQHGLISSESVLTSPQVAAVRSNESAPKAAAPTPEAESETAAEAMSDGAGMGGPGMGGGMGGPGMGESIDAVPARQTEGAATAAPFVAGEKPRMGTPVDRQTKKAARPKPSRSETRRPSTEPTPSPSVVQPAPPPVLAEVADVGGPFGVGSRGMITPAPATPPAPIGAPGPRGERGPVGSIGPAGPAGALSRSPAPSRAPGMGMGGAMMSTGAEPAAPGGAMRGGMPAGGGKSFSASGIDGPGMPGALGGMGAPGGTQPASPLTYAAAGMGGPPSEVEAMDTCAPAVPSEPEAASSTGIEVTFMPPSRREVGTPDVGAIVLKADRAVPNAVVRVTPGAGLSVTNAAKSGVLFSGPLRANKRTTLAVGLQADRPGSQRLRISVGSEVPEANATIDVRKLEYTVGVDIPRAEPTTAPRRQDVSVVFDETPIRDAFMAISRQGNVVIELAPEVTGTRVNAHLKQVPVEAAVRILCDEAGCDVAKDGAVYKVTAP